MALREAIMEASRVRLRPILMTTVTTALGLFPMSLGLGKGAELQQPLAISVIGGLMLATFLTLILIPLSYDLAVSQERQRKINHEDFCRTADCHSHDIHGLARSGGLFIFEFVS